METCQVCDDVVFDSVLFVEHKKSYFDLIFEFVGLTSKFLGLIQKFPGLTSGFVGLIFGFGGVWRGLKSRLSSWKSAEADCAISPQGFHVLSVGFIPSDGVLFVEHKKSYFDLIFEFVGLTSKFLGLIQKFPGLTSGFVGLIFGFGGVWRGLKSRLSSWKSAEADCAISPQGFHVLSVGFIPSDGVLFVEHLCTFYEFFQ